MTPWRTSSPSSTGCWDFARATSSWCPLQLTFIFGIWASLLAIRCGATLVLVQKFTPGSLAGLLAAEATVLAAVPTMLRALLADDAPTAPHLRAVLTGGEALSPILAQAVAGGWPKADLVDLYGSTETGSCDFCHRPRELVRRAASAFRRKACRSASP